MNFNKLDIPELIGNNFGRKKSLLKIKTLPKRSTFISLFREFKQAPAKLHGKH